jgi:hypothetical protein
MYRAPIETVVVLLGSASRAPETEREVLRRVHAERVARERAKSREERLAALSQGSHVSRRASAIRALVGLRRDPSRGH